VEEVLTRADLVESFNGRDTYDHNARSRAFARERGLAAVASSDAHRATEVGTVFVEYGAAPVRHGSSPRAIFFPTQRELHEHPLKRAAMELYHRHAGSVPGFVRDGYRAARRRFGREDAARARSAPTLQYRLGEAGGGEQDARQC
jgi:PHP-associated